MQLPGSYSLTENEWKTNIDKHMSSDRHITHCILVYSNKLTRKKKKEWTQSYDKGVFFLREETKYTRK